MRMKFKTAAERLAWRQLVRNAEAVADWEMQGKGWDAPEEAADFRSISAEARVAQLTIDNFRSGHPAATRELCRTFKEGSLRVREIFDAAVHPARVKKSEPEDRRGFGTFKGRFRRAGWLPEFRHRGVWNGALHNAIHGSPQTREMLLEDRLLPHIACAARATLLIGKEELHWMWNTTSLRGSALLVYAELLWASGWNVVYPKDSFGRMEIFTARDFGEGLLRQVKEDPKLISIVQEGSVKTAEAMRPLVADVLRLVASAMRQERKLAELRRGRRRHTTPSTLQAGA